jgi:mannosidase alpha-like ER degradation enhancer 2
VLSVLTGDERYGAAAFRAVQALYSRRSQVDLVGKHINIRSGKWTEEASGVGSNADSFYEYLLKGALLFPPLRRRLMRMFKVTFAAIKKHVQRGDWFVETEMYNGQGSM